MALARLPGGGWIEACAVSAVMAMRHSHDLWVVAVTFRDGVTQRLIANEPMDHGKASNLADEVAGIVQKSNDELDAKRHIAKLEAEDRSRSLIEWATRVAKSGEGVGR